MIEAAVKSDVKRRKKSEEVENQQVVFKCGVDILEESNLPEILETNKISTREVASQTECQTNNKKIQFNVNSTFGRRRGTNTEGSKHQSTSSPAPRASLFPLIYSSCSSSSEDDSNKNDDDFDVKSLVLIILKPW